MDNKLRPILDLIQKAVSFKCALLLPEEKKTSWYPILKFGNNHNFVGILEDGQWAVDSKEGLYCLNKPERYVRVFYLLEQSISTVQEDLETFFKNINIITEIDEIFPFVDIVKRGFEQGSEYWADLAFNWYNEFSPKKKISLEESLSQLMNAKWASQNLRHRAKKEFFRLKKLREPGAKDYAKRSLPLRDTSNE